MKKKFIYIVLFLSGLILGLFVISNISFNNFFDNNNKKINYLASSNPVIERKIDFINSASSMIGKEIIVSGIVKVGYKNKSDELVIFIEDGNLPFEVNCTLIQSNQQIKKPLKLGENMILKGTFTKLGEYIILENCIIIQRFEVVDN